MNSTASRANMIADQASAQTPIQPAADPAPKSGYHQQPVAYKPAIPAFQPTANKTPASKPAVLVETKPEKVDPPAEVPKERWHVTLIEKGVKNEKGEIKAAIRLNGDKVWLKVSEKAVPFLNKIPDGAYVKISFFGSETISAISEVDEYGEAIQRPKMSYKSSNWSNKIDPEQEFIKNQFILHECMLKEAIGFKLQASDKGCTPEETAKEWDEILDLVIAGAKKITAGIKEAK